MDLYPSSTVLTRTPEQHYNTYMLSSCIVVDFHHLQLFNGLSSIISFKPHLSPAYWGMTYQHCAYLRNITSGNKTSSPYMLWHNKPFDLLHTPILLFGSIVAAHRPLARQTALSGRSIEAVFAGIAPDFTVGIVLFNPTKKRTFIRHPFKYLSDAEPVSTSYIVTDSTPAGGEVLADLTLTDDPAHSSISSHICASLYCSCFI